MKVNIRNVSLIAFGIAAFANYDAVLASNQDDQFSLNRIRVIPQAASKIETIPYRLSGEGDGLPLPFAVTGLCAQEPSHTWANGHEVIFTIPVTQDSGKIKSISFKDTFALVSPTYNQNVHVFLNGNPVQQYAYTWTDRAHTINIPFPDNIEDASIRFALPNACLPSCIDPLNPDSRTLSIGFKGVDVTMERNERIFSYNMGVDSDHFPFTLCKGFSGAEISHRWTDDKKAIIRIPVKQEMGQIKGVSFNTMGFVSANHNQLLNIWLNGTKINQYAYTEETPTHVIDIPFPAGMTGEAELKLVMPYAISPCDINPTYPDPRKLAIGFKNVDLTVENKDQIVNYNMGMADALLPWIAQEGFSGAEGDHRWTDGPVAKLQVSAVNHTGKIKQIKFDTTALISENYSQTLFVSLDNGEEREFTYNINTPSHSIEWNFPTSFLCNTEIMFRMPNACLPSVINSTYTDPRLLGISFGDVKITYDPTRKRRASPPPPPFDPNLWTKSNAITLTDYDIELAKLISQPLAPEVLEQRSNRIVEICTLFQTMLTKIGAAANTVDELKAPMPAVAHFLSVPGEVQKTLEDSIVNVLTQFIQSGVVFTKIFANNAKGEVRKSLQGLETYMKDAQQQHEANAADIINARRVAEQKVQKQLAVSQQIKQKPVIFAGTLDQELAGFNKSVLRTNTTPKTGGWNDVYNASQNMGGGHGPTNNTPEVEGCDSDEWSYDGY